MEYRLEHHLPCTASDANCRDAGHHPKRRNIHDKLSDGHDYGQDFWRDHLLHLGSFGGDDQFGGLLGAVRAEFGRDSTAVATAAGYSTSLAASAVFQLQTASGTYTHTITPTAIASGSPKPLQITPIQLTLTVK